MSERGSFRGRGGGRGGAGGGGGRGGAPGGGSGGGGHSQAEKPKKENILDLTKYMNKEINVKFTGGREGMCVCCVHSGFNQISKHHSLTLFVLFRLTVIGTLKGYDQLMNLVLDDVKELLRGIVPISSTPLLVYLSLLANETTDDEGNESSRSLGLIVARGTLLVLISPVDGSEQIDNPFNVAEE